jgi:ankyrin repeat protein
MDICIINGEDIYKSLPVKNIDLTNLNIIQRTYKSTVYELDNIIIKSQSISKIDSINEYGDYGFYSSVLLEGTILSILNKFNTENFPKLLDFYINDGNIYIEMEKVNGKTLTEIHSSLSYIQKEAIIFQLFNILYQAELYEFIHGDLIGSNIIIEFVEEKDIDYKFNNTIFKKSNCGINVVLIDFEFSRMTAYNTYIFNEVVRKKYHKDKYDVPYNPMFDICKIFGNPDLMTQGLKNKTNIKCNYNCNNFPIEPFDRKDFYEIMVMLFNIPRRNKPIIMKTINEDKSIITSEYDEEYLMIRELINYKEGENKKNINHIENLEILLAENYFRLAYKFLTYFPDVKIEYYRIEPGQDSYTKNSKIINKLRKLKPDNYIKPEKKFNIINISNENRLSHKEGETAYDPIMIEYVYINNWLEDIDNIIFHLSESIIATKKSYYNDIPESNLIIEVILNKYGDIEFNNTRNSNKYINLIKYGIDAIIEYDYFNSVIKSNLQEFTILQMDRKIMGINYQYILHNPKSYITINSGKYGFKQEQFNSLRNYTYKWDKAINSYLRSGLSDEEYIKDKTFLNYYNEYGNFPEEALNNIKNAISNIDNSFNEYQMTEDEIIVFRGTEDNKVYDGLNLGFISTTISMNVALGFIKNNGCIHEIHISEGIPYVYLESLSQVKGEEEILLPRNLIVTLVEKKSPSYYIVKVTRSNDYQFSIEKEYLEVPLYKFKDYDYNYIKKNKKIKNSIINNQLIDEVTGDIIDMSTAIYNEGMYYNKETIINIFTSISLNHDKMLFLDPFTRKNFGSSILLQILYYIPDYFKEHAAIFAVKNGYINIIKDLNDKGFNLHFTNDILFLYACENNNIDIIKYLIDIGVDINIDNGKVLYYAVKNNNMELFDYSLNNGININNEKAFKEACFIKNFDMVKKFISVGINIDFLESVEILIINKRLDIIDYLINNSNHLKLDYKFLIYSINESNLEYIKYFIDKGVKIININGILMSRIVEKGNIEIIEYLYRNGLDIYMNIISNIYKASSLLKNDIVTFLLGKLSKPINDISFIKELVKNSNLDSLKTLINMGISIRNNIDELFLLALEKSEMKIIEFLFNYLDNSNNPNYILSAINFNKKEIVKFLLEHGVTLFNPDGLLYGAAKKYNLVIINLLINYGADINFNDGELLVYSVTKNLIELTKFFINKGVNINAQNGLPLITCVKFEYITILQYLIHNGVNININNGEAIIEASNLNSSLSTEILKLLIENGADVNVRGGLALINASKNNYHNVKILIEHGIDINSYNGSALINAVKNKNIDIVKYLIKCGINYDNKIILLEAVKTGDINFFQLIINYIKIDITVFPDIFSLPYINYDIIEIFIKNGADVNINNGLPLIKLINVDNYELVNLLIENGANVNIDNDKPLIEASKLKDSNIFFLLIKNGANISNIDIGLVKNIDIINYIKDINLDKDKLLKAIDDNDTDFIIGFIKDDFYIDGYKLLMLYAISKKKYDIVNILKNYINNDTIFLTEAVKNNDKDMVNLLLSHNFKEYNNPEPLLESLKLDNSIIFFLLVNFGINYKNSRLEIINIAKEKGHNDIVEFITPKNDQEINSEIINAISSNNYSLTEFLIKFSTDINHNNGVFLFLATKSKNYKIVELLIKNGADVNINDGSALIQSLTNKSYDIIKLLIENGADVNIRKGILLSSAIDDYNEKLLELLIENGTDININNSKLLLDSIFSQHENLFYYLIKKGAEYNSIRNKIIKHAKANNRHDIINFLFT